MVKKNEIYVKIIKIAKVFLADKSCKRKKFLQSDFQNENEDNAFFC